VSQRPLNILLAAGAILSFSCPKQNDQQPVAAEVALTSDGDPPDVALVDAAADEPEPPPEPPPPPALDEAAQAARCTWNGGLWTLEQVASADIVDLPGSTGQPRSMVLAVVTRPPAKVLAIEGTPSYPTLRGLYMFRQPRGKAAKNSWRVRQMLSDPGPIRDNFGRRAYERVAHVRGACHRNGCLVAAVIERITPETEGASYTTWVRLLDQDGTPTGTWRPLAHEPDRGPGITTCLAAVNDGFLLATAVSGGRGRLLWLDRRATPLDQQYVPGGFSYCQLRPQGLQIDVVTQNAEGWALTSMSSHPSTTPAERDADDRDDGDGGPDSDPQLFPRNARLPTLLAASEARSEEEPIRPALAVWADQQGLQLLATLGEPPLLLSRHQPQWLEAAQGPGTLLIALVDGEGEARLIQVEGPEVTGVSDALAPAQRVWLAKTTRGGRLLAWRQEEILQLRRVSCTADQGPTQPVPEPRPLVPAETLGTTDQGRASDLRAEARRQLEAERNYRAAWLLERAYTLDRQRHPTLIEAAGLLTELRYSKAAMRILKHLGEVEAPEREAAQQALLMACTDRRLARFWRTTDFKRLTECPGPTDPEPEEESSEESDAPEGGEPAPTSETTSEN
jgi:hypothetical protein